METLTTLPKMPKLKLFSTAEPEKKDYLKNEVWVTAYYKRIPVREMETSHILKCIACFNGRGEVRIPEDYLGGKKKWMKIFNDELVNRQ